MKTGVCFNEWYEESPLPNEGYETNIATNILCKIPQTVGDAYNTAVAPQPGCPCLLEALHTATSLTLHTEDVV